MGDIRHVAHPSLNVTLSHLRWQQLRPEASCLHMRVPPVWHDSLEGVEWLYLKKIWDNTEHFSQVSNMYNVMN